MYEDGDVVVEKKHKDGVGSANKCPVGSKRVKQMKEDEMVDRLSQKFGIMSNKTTYDEETTQMKMMTKNSPALQEALEGFLSIAGQGMSAWMMQSMSNFTSDKIKKDYANEMMKQQILKIHHNNVKMMKELTEMKLVSSSRLKEKYRQLMKTNEWTHEEMSLKVQVNQKKPKKSGETITNKKKQNFYQCSKQFKGRCNHCGKYGHKKTDPLLLQ